MLRGALAGFYFCVCPLIRRCIFAHLKYGEMEHALEIIYEDEYLVAVNKPIGLPVHKGRGMAHDAPYVTKLLGQMLDCSVYNVHRLDAKTSGVLVLARSPEMANLLTTQFAERTVRKIYRAIVKGIPPEQGTFDLPVKKARKGKKAPSITHYQLLQTVAMGVAHKEEENQHLSLLELRPESGRWHQLRQHCGQQRYDIIGDSEHGDFALNRLVAAKMEMKRLYLHALQLTVKHPISEEALTFDAPQPDSFASLLQAF